jgi:hypothetical protein
MLVKRLHSYRVVVFIISSLADTMALVPDGHGHLRSTPERTQSARLQKLTLDHMPGSQSRFIVIPFRAPTAAPRTAERQDDRCPYEP